jgi:hypothetical protein
MQSGRSTTELQALIDWQTIYKFKENVKQFQRANKNYVVKTFFNAILLQLH